MLADMVNQKGEVEEFKKYRISDISITMTEIEKNDDTKQYSLKDIFNAFSKTSIVTPSVTPSTVTRG